MTVCRGLSIVFTCFLAIYLALNPFFLFGTQDDPSYYVIFDAGSTGSRARIYKVLQNASERCQYQVVDEMAFSIEPGISEFAHRPRGLADYLLPLLEKVKTCVPVHKRSHTPLILRATAGLRLLPKQIASEIIESVCSVFKTSEFQLVPQATAGIMDGIDEGLFAWISLIFLHQQSCLMRLEFQSPPPGEVISQHAVFDLGGGSFQLTFGVDSTSDPSEDIHDFPSAYLGTQFDTSSGKFFARTCLGLGLVSGMHSMFLRSKSVTSHHLLSPCFPSNLTGHWSYMGENWTISHDSGLHESRPSDTFNRCYQTAVDVVSECGLGAQRLKHLEDLKNMEIWPLSYMLSKAEEAIKLFTIKPTEGRVSVQWYFDAAREACSTSPPDNPFLCAELTYIFALLSHGFGLPMDKRLNLNRTIDGIEIGWPLGLLVDMLLRRS